MMQNHYEISSKTLFWNQNMQILTKSRDLVMSGPAKSWFGHVRTWKVVIWTCPDLSRRTSTYFKPSEILLFFQILQVPTSNHRKYFYFFRFYTFLFCISKFVIFEQHHVFLLPNLSFFIKSKTSMGPYGPQPGPAMQKIVR